MPLLVSLCLTWCSSFAPASSCLFSLFCLLKNGTWSLPSLAVFSSVQPLSCCLPKFPLPCSIASLQFVVTCQLQLLIVQGLHLHCMMNTISYALCNARLWHLQKIRPHRAKKLISTKQLPTRVHLQTSLTMLVTCVMALVCILRQLKPFLSQGEAKRLMDGGPWSGTPHSMMCNIVPQTTLVEELQGWLIHIEVAEDLSSCSIMGRTSSQPESHPLADTQPQDKWKPNPLCGSLPALVVPAERYVEQLWALLDKTLEYSTCGIGSDTPVGKGGTLDLKTLTVIGAVAPDEPLKLAPGVPPVFPLAITHWTMRAKELQSGLTLCAQPRRILAQQLCERVKENRKMHYKDRTVGYVIAKESSRDSSTKLPYCTEAIVALMMKAYLVSSDQPAPHELITTVVIDEVHNRSAHSDNVLALTLAAMQKKSTLRLVLMSARESTVTLLPVNRLLETTSCFDERRCTFRLR